VYARERVCAQSQCINGAVTAGGACVFTLPNEFVGLCAANATVGVCDANAQCQPNRVLCLNALGVACSGRGICCGNYVSRVCMCVLCVCVCAVPCARKRQCAHLCVCVVRVHCRLHGHAVRTDDNNHRLAHSTAYTGSCRSVSQQSLQDNAGQVRVRCGH
jgi:hypothetical protein